MKKAIYTRAFLFLLISAVLFGCNTKNSTKSTPNFASNPLIKRDLKEIKESGELRAITIYNSTGYFLYRGQAMGFEYDLLNKLAEELDVELKIVVADNIDELFDMLNRGEGDLAAYGLAVTEGRKQFVRFTEHLYVTHQTLVQRKPENWRKIPRHKTDKQLVKDPLDLINDTIHVRKNSSYAARIEALSNEIGGPIYIEYINGKLTTDEIIGMVADGEIKYTVADENIALLNATYHPILDINTALSFSQRISWALRKNSPKLNKAVNEWIKPIKKTDFYWATYNKYFKHKRTYAKRLKSPFFSKSTGQISAYDEIIKQESEKINWDWRLVSSVIYQESKFDPQAKSWAGAIGLMQMLPSTGREFLSEGTLAAPKSNIKAGTSYLEYLFNKWVHVEDTIQRQKFTLASYNCGYAHLLDAQRLTSRNGLDSLRYDDNVEYYLKQLSKKEFYTKPFIRYGYVRGTEPYNYVRQIFKRYQRYKQLLPDSTQLETIDTPELAISKG